MAFNGSGVHNRVHDWTQDLANTIPVTASRMDAEHDDISAALSNTICRDGQSTTTARIPFASGVSAAAGTTSSVAYAQTNDPNTGLYFPATDQWGLVAGGTASLTSTAAKLTATVAVDFTGAAAPTSDDGAALGSTSQKWSDLFLASGGVINFSAGDATITHSSNTLAVAGCTVTFDTPPTPSSSDAAALGTSSAMWSDLFLASGAVINFNAGDVTVTHSANTLAFAGASSGYTFDAGVTTTGALSAATAAGNIIASKAEMETATATDKLVAPGRVQSHPGVAKAWGQINYSGGTPVLSSGYNCDTPQDAGTGLVTINWLVPFSGANYAVICSTNRNGGSLGRLREVTVHSQDANSVQFRVGAATGNADTTITLTDLDFNFVAFGDQ